MSDPAHIRALCDRIYDALTISEHPPSSKGEQGVGAGASRPPMPTVILDAKEDLKAKLVSWALMIGEEGDVVVDCDNNSYSIAAWIYTKADWLAEHPAVDDFVTEVEEKLQALRLPYQAKTELEYCGEHQGEKVYVRRGQRTAVLADGTVEQVKTLKAWSNTQMLDVIDTPKMVAEIVSVIFGRPITAKAITTAYSDDHNPNRPCSSKVLEPAVEDRGRKFYRVSDVLERFGMSSSGSEDLAVS